MRIVIKSTKLFSRFERHENLAQAIALLEEAQICSSCVAFTLNAARKRNQSFDSDEYNIKSQTACETNKKISHYPKERGWQTKKLNMNDAKNKKGIF